MTQEKHSLTDLLKVESPIDVVDIGANPIEGDPPYKPLLDLGLAHVIGFEPNPLALDSLNAKKSQNETYIPGVVYDGNEQELKVCMSQGMTSLLEPNSELLSYFFGFPEWGKVKARLSVPTLRLDDVTEIKNIDYLKIDIQGAELKVFQNGTERLRDCLVIHTEVEFLPMYEDQPLFSEVELFLRELGFILHRFFPLESRAVEPLVINGDINIGLGQLFWADAIFIKDFTKFNKLGSQSLKKMALILHEIYGSYDIALRALKAHDLKVNSKLSDEYLIFLSKLQLEEKIAKS
ncbi:MAG: FkbM family methyltransferase [Rhodospirillaceae bacterium]|jgi:FkbM family methyltransferase|nr:FkbM family methyltransferase [Rhodospirillaceae bacterium]MBT7954114.1 FkbM family methyltransferase [Rhodospirillaceae bacterium]